MSQSTYGTIVNYRIGIRTQKPKECLIQFARGGSASDVGRLVGRKVVLMEGKKKFIGKIVGLHGKKGVVRARFRRGVPGQALGKTVELIG